MNKIVVDLVAGIPLSVIGIVYMLVWGQGMIAALMESDSSFAEFPDGALFWMFLGTFALAPLAFGALSGVVYGLIGSPLWFLALAAGLAVLFSVLAVVSRTPLTAAKVVMNFAVGIVLGVLVPLLHRGWPNYLSSF